MSRRPMFGDTVPTQFPPTASPRHDPEPEPEPESAAWQLFEWVVLLLSLMALLHAWAPLLTQWG